MVSQSTSDPVPAITEREATGETAQIYRDIRTTLGVPVVNLIWRHLATMPDALPWVWNSVRPAYAAGAVARAATHLRQSLSLPQQPPWPVSELETTNLNAEDRMGIRRVLKSYDRSNAMNLVALGALQARIHGQIDPTPLPKVDAGENIEGELPRLLPMAEMDPATADLVQRLNAVGDNEQRVIASMYRHLAHWPGFLQLVWERLEPIAADGSIDRMIQESVETGRGISRQLAAIMTPPADIPAPETVVQVNAALDLFIHHAIGRMVPIGRMLTVSFPSE